MALALKPNKPPIVSSCRTDTARCVTRTRFSTTLRGFTG
jgi:hypothetical protein